MSTKIFRGGAAAVPKVVTLTVGGTIEVGDLFLITIGQKTLSVAASSVSAAVVAAQIVTAFNALDTKLWPEFSGELTAAAGTGGTLTLTSKVAGRDFTVTPTTTEAGGGAADTQTFTQSTTTENSGPHDWRTLTNWSTGALPLAEDEVIIEEGTSIKYGLNQSTVCLASLTIYGDGPVGLPEVNPAGYREYRPTYLAIGAAEVKITGATTRIKLDNGSDQVAGVIDSTGRGADGQAVIWKGTHASNAWTINGGTLGIAYYPGEVATVDSLRYNFRAQGGAQAGSVEIGDGATIGTVVGQGGMLTTGSSVTALTNYSGEVHFTGAAALTALNNYGKVYWESSGELGGGTCYGAALLDYRNDNSLRTVGGVLKCHSGAEVQDPLGSVTWSEPIELVGCHSGNVKLSLGSAASIDPYQ